MSVQPRQRYFRVMNTKKTVGFRLKPKGGPHIDPQIEAMLEKYRKDGQISRAEAAYSRPSIMSRMRHPDRRRRECVYSHGFRPTDGCGRRGRRPTEPAKAGGITELCKVFSIATVRNVTVMLHSFYDGPGLLAAIHATAALGGSQAMVEWREFDLEAQIYGGALAPKVAASRCRKGPVWALSLMPTLFGPTQDTINDASLRDY
jgi:hypothetical protein